MNYYKRHLSLNKDIDKAQRVSSTDVVRAYLRESMGYGKPLCGITKKHLRITTLDEAQTLLDKLNEPGMRTYETLQLVQSQHDVWQRFDCIKGNLRGFIYYFECSGCETFVKYIYRPDGSYLWRCRECHGLVYKRKPRTRESLSQAKHRDQIPRQPKPFDKNFWGYEQKI